MISERLELSIERALDSFDEILTGPPESVGTILIDDLVKDERYKGFNIAILHFTRPDVEEKSQKIYRVPDGWVEVGKRAEVIVRIGRLSTTLNLPSKCLVAIRPYNRETYGSPVGLDDKIIKEMFHANHMKDEKAPAFHERFIRSRRF